MEEASWGTLAVGHLFLSPHLFRSAIMPDVGARFGSNGSFSLRFLDMRHHFFEQLHAPSMQTIAFASYLKAHKYLWHFVPSFISTKTYLGKTPENNIVNFTGFFCKCVVCPRKQYFHNKTVNLIRLPKMDLSGTHRIAEQHINHNSQFYGDWLNL